jgi:hypothetical protein
MYPAWPVDARARCTLHSAFAGALAGPHGGARLTRGDRAGAQYCGHAAGVVGLAALPGRGALVASVDAAGALHLWSAATGALARRFAEPATPAELARGPGAPPAREVHYSIFQVWHASGVGQYGMSGI